MSTCRNRSECVENVLHCARCYHDPKYSRNSVKAAPCGFRAHALCASGHGNSNPRGSALFACPMNWHDHFTYDGDSGKLIWKWRPRHLFKTDLAWVSVNGRQSGTEAGTPSNGYLAARIDYKQYKVHRIIWEMMNGPIPDGYQIDHIDGNRMNNVLSNLRLATPSQQVMNRGLFKNNTSGYKGVSKCSGKHRKGWIASIVMDGKQKNYGPFETPEDAYAKYCEMATIHYGEFARLK